MTVLIRVTSEELAAIKHVVAERHRDIDGWVSLARGRSGYARAMEAKRIVVLATNALDGAPVKETRS